MRYLSIKHHLSSSNNANNNHLHCKISNSNDNNHHLQCEISNSNNNHHLQCKTIPISYPSTIPHPRLLFINPRNSHHSNAPIHTPHYGHPHWRRRSPLQSPPPPPLPRT